MEQNVAELLTKKVTNDYNLIKAMIKAELQKEDPDIKTNVPSPPIDNTIVNQEEEEEEEDDWTCAGHVWENPPIPCPKNTPRCKIRYPAKLRHNRRQYTLCKECRGVINKIKRGNKKK